MCWADASGQSRSSDDRASRVERVDGNPISNTRAYWGFQDLPVGSNMGEKQNIYVWMLPWKRSLKKRA